MMVCIFCNDETESVSIEHIVPESFGNKHYVMKKGQVCDVCNSRFSKFEAKALSNSVFVIERARFGVVTKKGKNVKGKIEELDIEGHPEFKEKHITVKGLNPDNFKEFNSETQVGKLYVKTFDKSEVATSKLLLKMAFESITKSRKELLGKYNFDELKDYLLNKENAVWPFIVTDTNQDYISVPRYDDKHKLSIIRCHLKFLEDKDGNLLFYFKYGAVSMIINCVDRNIDWIKEFYEIKNDISIYPESIIKKIKPKEI